ncbi:TonB-dependent receptor domain-containing protein [Flavobacterium magnesitis]|uniref:TonB-dependent receptor n=1 Tax=Flavobacterium magnesitis TaxID=3138077 RepID=UPI00358EBDA1
MQFNKWIFCLLLLVGNIGSAQKNVNKIPLTNIIKTIEKQFDIKFSYAVEDISNISIEKPSSTLNLQQTIDYLNAKVPLNFKALDGRYITISVLNKTVSICGVIFDENLKTTLPGASIRINNSSNSSVASTNGTFNLENISIDATVMISYLGYETQEFKAKDLFSNDKNCPNIFLKPTKVELNQVLIPVFLTSGLQKSIDGSTILNTKKFGILPGLTEPDILQSIQTLPGVESTNESIANINIRGGTNDQNLMLWDNIKMYHSGHFFGLISAYNPNLTSKIVVTKNGTSAEYSDGVSSMINMSTNNEIKNTVSGGAGINLISGDAFVEIPLAKNLELDLSARHSITDFINTPTYNTYYKKSFQDSEINANNLDKNVNSDFYFYDYTAKILYDLNDKHQFRANIIGITNELNYSENNSDQTQSKTSALSQKNIGYGGNWKAQWNSKFSTQLSSYFSKYNIDASDYRIATDQLLTEANEVIETAIKLNLNYNFNEKIRLLAGYQINETGMLNQTQVSAPFYSSTKKDVLLNHALYAETEYNHNNTYVRLGMRLNYFEKFDKLLFEPRINFRQQIFNPLAIKLEGEFKNQTSTQIIDFEDDFLGVEKRRWQLVNNKDIPIAKSKQASVGLEFNKNNLNIELSGFYKIVDGITASNQGFYNNFQSKNAHGSYTNKGIEFLINKTTQKFSTWLSYTLSNNNYYFESFTPSTFPNNVDIRHSVTLGFNYNILNNLKISVGGIWHSGQPYTKAVEGDETVQSGNNIFVNYDTPNSHNLDDFLRLDTSLSYNFNFNSAIKATFRAGIINLTNEKNYINRYYKVDPDDTEKAIEVNNRSLAFTPNVSFRIHF